MVTVMPYYYTNDFHLTKQQQTHTDITQYCKQVMTSLADGSNNKNSYVVWIFL